MLAPPDDDSEPNNNLQRPIWQGYFSDRSATHFAVGILR